MLNHKQLVHPNVVQFKEVRSARGSACEGTSWREVQRLGLLKAASSLLTIGTTAMPQVFVNDTHLGVALEFAAGGELFDTVARAGKLPEIEARYFFQQLILGLEYCHKRVRHMFGCT